MHSQALSMRYPRIHFGTFPETRLNTISKKLLHIVQGIYNGDSVNFVQDVVYSLVNLCLTYSMIR